MPDNQLPLIPLGPPHEVARPKQSPRPVPKPRIPGFDRQVARLAQTFQRLEQALRERTVQIQDALASTPVEQVLVLETVGDVREFERAVRKVRGLEWLFDLEDKIDPDEDFYFENDPNKPVQRRLFLVMSDESAVEQLMGLWQSYQENPAAPFPRGLALWKHVFQQLKVLRFWDERDRLEQETLDYWRDELSAGQQSVRSEVEIWYSSSDIKNRSARQALEAFVLEAGGRTITWAEISDIRYHAALIELPAQVIQEILNGHYPQLVLYQRVMFFRPRALGMSSPVAGAPEFATFPATPSDQEPVVALLDGLPVQNHQSLAGRLVIDDPDGWEATYPAASRVHGTGMASLVLHGDLSNSDGALHSKVYVRPILRPDGNGHECTPNDQLLVDLVHRAVRRIVEGDGQEAAVCPSVRVVNLSVGDERRSFNGQLSPWARLLDWLSWKHKLLFCVSAGNATDTVQLDILRRDFAHITRQDLQSEVLVASSRSARTRVLLNPAESVNAVTVGAAYSDSSTYVAAPGRHEVYQEPLPAPYSRAGLGYRGAIKPDVLFPGGRGLYIEQHGPAAEPAVLRAVHSTQPPGQRTASPAPAGQLNGYLYLRGTSNAAALASRHVARIWEALQPLAGQIEGIGERGPDVALLKALLVHGASWSQVRDLVENMVITGSSRARKDALTRLLGYGLVEPSRALACTPERATLIACGTIAPEQVHEYRIPLPPTLSGIREWRRLTVTLAYVCPIVPTRQAYRGVKVSFDPPHAPLHIARMDADYNAVQLGSVQHEVLEGDRAVAYLDGESVMVPVECKELAGAPALPVPYGLCISIEVAQGVQVPVYEEIRARVRPIVRVAA